VLDGREHGGIIAAVGRHVPEARAVYTRVLTAANKCRRPVRERQLRPYESEQIRVDHVCVRRAHAVWKARVYLERAVLEPLGLK
jgi:hypothetical protein